MPKVWNKRDKNVPKDAVYVGRPSIYGNPFVINKSGLWSPRNNEEAVKMYREWLDKGAGGATNPPGMLIRNIKAHLKGKDLVCWCAPKPCHADVLLEIANEF